MPLNSTRGAGSAKGFGFTAGGGGPFVSATGGTVLTCGDYKIHVFTGPGSFVVSSAGKPTGSTTVDYLVVAGGGGGGIYGGGGGAGGFRQSYPNPATGGFPIIATSYPITVGAGGADCQPPQDTGIPGNNSIFSTITSAGGGGGMGYETPSGSGSGGSGGGAGTCAVTTSKSGGTGNTPPVSPSQGNPGGPGNYGSRRSGGGGGGASTAGSAGPGSGPAGPGGPGTPMADAFFGPTAPSYGTPGPAPGRWFAGGGGGYLQGIVNPAAMPQGLGGSGGGGNGGNLSVPGADSQSGTVNTGGGGGGSAGSAGDGGSGIVVIRYKFQ